MLWKSNSRYNEDAKKFGTVFELKDNELGIVIHKYAGCGNSLFLTSRKLKIDMFDLGTEDFDEAVRISKNVINKQIYKITEEAKKFYLDESENEITRY